MKVEENKITFYGRAFGSKVQLVIERGQVKNDKGEYEYTDEVGGRVVIWADKVNHIKKDDFEKYLINLPITLIDEVVKAISSNEQGVADKFNRWVAGDRIWELKRLKNQGASEGTIRALAKDIGISDEIVEKVLEG